MSAPIVSLFHSFSSSSLNYFKFLIVAALLVLQQKAVDGTPNQNRFKVLDVLKSDQVLVELLSTVVPLTQLETEVKKQKTQTQRSKYSSTIDPCIAPTATEAIVTFADQNITFFHSSFFEKCIGSLTVDYVNMLRHVSALFGIFRDYYCFYDVARNPSLSDPLNYQPELGYTLFGEGEGQVDLTKRLNDTYQEISRAGYASAAHFWDLQSIFNSLRDDHVSLPALRDSLTNCTLSVVPERCLPSQTDGYSQTLARAEFFYSTTSIQRENETEQLSLQMKITWFDTVANVTTGESVVESIDCKTVAQFVLDLASTNALGGYQSVGARVNSLLTFDPVRKRNLINAGSFTDSFLPYLFSLSTSARPSDIFPDTFTVTYIGEDKPETFYTVALNPFILDNLVVELIHDDKNGTDNNATIVFMIDDAALGENDSVPFIVDRQEAEFRINQPGDSYLNFRTMLGAIDDASSSSSAAAAAVKTTKAAISNANDHIFQEDDNEVLTLDNSLKRESRISDNDEFDFDLLFYITDPYNSGVRELSAAYKIQEDHAVLKLQSFGFNPNGAVEIWGELCKDAKAAGVSKLIFDISNNQGGFVATSYSFIAAMFPLLDYKFFKFQWDLTYNEQMDMFLKAIVPLFPFWDTGDGIVFGEQLENLVNSFTPDQINALVVTATAMDKFCTNNCLDFAERGQRCVGCDQLTTLLQRTLDFSTNVTSLSLTNLLATLFEVMNEIQPWTVTTGGQRLYSQGRTGKRSLVRGGVLSNITQLITDIFPENLFEFVANASLSTGHRFDDYIILSNGVAASSSAIFSSFASQLWKNRQDSMVGSIVKTVSFGGTGNIDDLIMASIPASVTEVQIQYPILTDGALYMLETMFPNVENISLAREMYESTLYIPPYFADSLPRLPVLSYYDKFMKPMRTIPLQYVKMPPDHYIPKLYSYVSFLYHSDLGNLYTDTSAFFSTPVTSSVSNNRIEQFESQVAVANVQSSTTHRFGRGFVNCATTIVFLCLTAVLHTA